MCAKHYPEEKLIKSSMRGKVKLAITETEESIPLKRWNEAWMKQKKRKRRQEGYEGLLFKDVRLHEREVMGNKRLEDCYSGRQFIQAASSSREARLRLLNGRVKTGEMNVARREMICRHVLQYCTSCIVLYYNKLSVRRGDQSGGVASASTKPVCCSSAKVAYPLTWLDNTNNSPKSHKHQADFLLNRDLHILIKAHGFCLDLICNYDDWYCRFTITVSKCNTEGGGLFLSLKAKKYLSFDSKLTIIDLIIVGTEIEFWILFHPSYVTHLRSATWQMKKCRLFYSVSVLQPPEVHGSTQSAMQWQTFSLVVVFFFFQLTLFHTDVKLVPVTSSIFSLLFFFSYHPTDHFVCSTR